MPNIKDFIKKIGSATVSVEEQQQALSLIEQSLKEARQKREKEVGDKANMVVDALKQIENRLNAKFIELSNTPALVGEPGKDGKDGKDGAPGPVGPAGRNGKDGKDGKDGIDGKDGVGVVDAKIEFDGSLVITLSDGNEIDAGLIIPPDIAEQYNAYMTRGDLLPPQTGNSGKYLTTDGTDLSWDQINISTSDISGTLPIANGGTGATTAPQARTNLGLGSIATQDANNVAITGGTIDGTTIGGTTPAQGNFTNVRINQSWDEGTGRLQVNGQAAIEGNAVAQDVVVQGGNNLVIRSQEFNDAIWLKQNSSIVANTVVAPNGTLTGNKLVENTSNGAHFTAQSISITSGVTYTNSVFAKASGRNWVRLAFSGGAFPSTERSAVFDLANGVVGQTQQNVSATITPVGDGWYRCAISATAITTTTPVDSISYAPATQNIATIESYQGDGTSGIYLWGAQLERGTVASPYTPTTSAAVTTTNDIFVPSGQVLPALGTASLPSYSILGDTNTGLFSPAADTLAVSTGGSERVRVDSSGNVGIGTSSPAVRLHVLLPTNGTGAILSVPGNSSSVSNVELALNFNSGSIEGAKLRAIKSSLAGSDLILLTSTNNNQVATEKVRLLAGGNFGIGTNSPTNILSFGGNAARTIWMERHTTADTAGNNLTVQSGGATSGATDKAGGTLLLSSGTATGTGSSVITFLTATAGTTGTADNAPTEKMRIDGAGRVGIGTNSPTSLLQIQSIGSGNHVLIGNSEGNNALVVSRITSNQSWLRIGAFSNAGSIEGGPVLSFATSNADGSSGVERGRFNASGELIIGNGDAVASPANGVLRGTNGSGTNITGATLTIQGGRGTGSASGGPIIFSTSAAGSSGTTLNAASERVRITAAGNVGINTSSPAGLLHVRTANFTDTLLSERTSSSTSSFLGGLRIKHTTSDDMVDGFGVAFVFQIRDNAGVDNSIVSIGAERTGADNSGAFVIRPLNAGVETERVRVAADGKVGIGTTGATALLDVNSDIIRLRTAKTPATAGAAGNQGDICWDADYVYICTATNTWKRAAIATW